MSERPSPYLAYSPERLTQAAQELEARITRAEHNLQRACARQQQAEVACQAVRRLLERARADQRLIEALLKETENLFEAEEGEAENCTQQSRTAGTLLSPCSAPVLPLTAPVPPPVSMPEHLRPRGLAR